MRNNMMLVEVSIVLKIKILCMCDNPWSDDTKANAILLCTLNIEINI